MTDDYPLLWGKASDPQTPDPTKVKVGLWRSALRSRAASAAKETEKLPNKTAKMARV